MAQASVQIPGYRDPATLTDEEIDAIVSHNQAHGDAPPIWRRACESEYRRRFLPIGGTAQEWAEALPEFSPA